MAMPARGGGRDLASNPRKFYGLYTGCFFAFVILLAILERFGVPNSWLGYGFVFATLAAYAVIGVISRTREVGEYFVAGRRVPAFYNGMATGADCMSAASFVGMAGSLFLLGYDGLAFVIGWTGGFVLIAILIAPFLRKFGAYTVPDFFAGRFGGSFNRFLAVVVLVCCSFLYVTAQVYATGLIASRFLGMDFTVAVYVGLAGILLCSMLGGMKAVTWTQVAQYIVLIIAYLTPIVILSSKKYGLPIPELTYGQAISDIAQLEQSMISKGLADAQILKPHTQPFLTYDPLNYFALILCLMVGTASLPHILMRYFTTPSVREARVSVAWSLVFIFLLYVSAPAYAAFSKLEVYSLIDKGTSLSALPAWIYTYGKLGLVKICGANAVDPTTVAAACAKIAGHPGLLRHQDLGIDTDVIVLSTPEIAGMPYVIAGLVAAGGLAAALSTADGLLLAIANALSHDVCYKMLAPKSSVAARLIVSRVLLVGVAGLAAYTASTRPSDILTMVSWALSLAAAGIFPALVLGIWWKRANSWGCAAGMIAGFGLCVTYLVVTRYFPGFGVAYLGMTSNIDQLTGQPLVNLSAAMAAANAFEHWVTLAHPMASKVGWLNVNNISSGLFSIPVGVLTIWIVSLLTPAPSREIQDMVDATRRPAGDTILSDKDAALPAH